MCVAYMVNWLKKPCMKKLYLEILCAYIHSVYIYNRISKLDIAVYNHLLWTLFAPSHATHPRHTSTVVWKCPPRC